MATNKKLLKAVLEHHEWELERRYLEGVRDALMGQQVEIAKAVSAAQRGVKEHLAKEPLDPSEAVRMILDPAIPDKETK